jgi:hypothetical protein
MAQVGADLRHGPMEAGARILIRAPKSLPRYPWSGRESRFAHSIGFAVCRIGQFDIAGEVQPVDPPCRTYRSMNLNLTQQDPLNDIMKVRQCNCGWYISK